MRHLLNKRKVLIKLSNLIIMKLIYLNIFENCEEKERLDNIINFINKEKPDVFLYQKLKNGMKVKKIYWILN